MRIWSEMTGIEKREQRFAWWLDTQGINFVTLEAEKAYKQRVQRYIDVYQLKEPDRVPVQLPPGHLAVYVWN